MRWILAKCLLLLLIVGPVVSFAQVVTTTVTDTIFHADGSKAAGLVLVSWPAFTTAAGQAVAGGSQSVTIGANGVLALALAPNQGATPAGTFYTAVYHLDDGTVTREFWAVPVSSSAVLLSGIRSAVLPAAVAVQTASKSYVDSAVAAALSGHPITGDVTFLSRVGDAMLGPLTLSGDPTTGVQAANKHYVDTAVSSVSTGLAKKVGTAPDGAQVVAQPTGTQMQVNRLNGVSYASQYESGRGGNGLTNTIGAPECAGGCQVAIEQGYGSTEHATAAAWNSDARNGTHVEDLRGGGRHDHYLNPVNVTSAGLDFGQYLEVASTRSASSVYAATSSQAPASIGLQITHEGLTGGSNQYPATIPGNNSPIFKSNYNALSVYGVYNTMGQHVLASNAIDCYGVGDCLIGSQFIHASGGFRDEADEGTHPMDLQYHEDSKVFRGTCGAGCTTGSTKLSVNVTESQGTQGEGRFLLNMNPAQAITTGALTGGGPIANGLVGPTATFSGTTFPVSVYLATKDTIPASTNAVAPGTVTVALATSGLPSLFQTSTAALPQASGVACVADPAAVFNPPNYEMASYAVIDATHLRMTLNKVHAGGSTIAVGGLCGYGLEQTIDTVKGIRQVFPVIGSSSPTALFYAGNLTPIVGRSGQTGGYTNVSVPISSVTRTGQVATMTTASALPVDLNGVTLTIAGVADASFNGQAVVTTTGPNTLTYASAGGNATSSGGSVTALTGGFALYPMAEVLGVFNQDTKKIDGQLTLAANTVPWAVGDPVEEPHYFQESVMADAQFIGQFVPRSVIEARPGVVFEDTVGPGVHGWSIQNSSAATNYFGNGGTHGAPTDAFEARGVWNHVMEMQAGETGVFQVHCNSKGCGRWNSGYNVFELDSTAGTDVLSYQPGSSALSLTLRGASYGFTPQGFSAPVVTAGALHGSLNAGDVASGTLTAARLPIFGGAGTGHAVGAVPDPGSTAGASRFLREDGVWALTPAGASGGGGGSATGTAAITGGSIDGATIGQSTPAAGHFTEVSSSNCGWSLKGTNQGLGTCTPTSWNAVSGVDGSNLQIFGAASSRLIVSSGGGSGALAEFHFVNLGAPSGARNWRMSNDTSGRYTLDMSTDNYSRQTIAMQCQADGSCRFPNGITAANFNGVLSGTTAVIGGAQLAAGACTSGTATVQGAIQGTPVAVSASDGSLPSGLTMLRGAVVAAGMVTVQVCAVGPVTPAAVSYNVRVLQ